MERPCLTARGLATKRPSVFTPGGSTAANANLDLPPNSPAGVAPSQRETAPGPRQDKSARRGQSAQPRANPAHRQNSVRSALEPPAAPKPPARVSRASAARDGAQPRTQPRTKSSSLAELQPKPGSNVQPSSVRGVRTKKASMGRQPVGVAQGSASAASPSFSCGNLPSKSTSRPARGSKLQSRAKTGSNALPADWRTADAPSSRSASRTTALLRTAQSGDGKNLAKLGRHDLQWDPIGELDQVTQRRAIVSIRLTDGEFLRIKDRASESGISVSAYMRSCVVDPDQLRAQVKQALAEMRALSARPEPNHFPALAASKDNDSAAGMDWLRLLMRSAAFLLSPLFPFRRSA